MSKSQVPADLQSRKALAGKEHAKHRGIAFLQLVPGHLGREGKLAFPKENGSFSDHKPVDADEASALRVFNLNPLVEVDLVQEKLGLHLAAELLLEPDPLGLRAPQARLRDRGGASGQ